MKLKHLKPLLVLALSLGMAAGVAFGESTDTIDLIVTPIYNLSVNIVADSTNYGLMNMGSSKTLNVGNIWNNGDITSKWQKRAENSSGGWTLDADGAPGTDAFALLAITTMTGTSPEFENTQFNSILKLGTSQSFAYVTASYEDLTEGASGGDTSPIYMPGTTRDLWVSLMMPTMVSSGAQQTITLSIQAVLP